MLSRTCIIYVMLLGSACAAPCVEDCTKVLVAGAKPYVRGQVIEKPKVDEAIKVEACVEYNGKCSPVDPRTGFYTIVTSEDL